MGIAERLCGSQDPMLARGLVFIADGIETIPAMSQTEKDFLARISELEAENKKLKSRKKYGLVWEEKDEDVVLQCREKLPVLSENTGREIKVSEENPTNILIEGDNYHALSVLNYTHKNKIDVIYIDPPYNTGAKDWKYNNDYVETEDPWRHSKWLSMMNKRLLLARNLLAKNGTLICAIDDYELNTLGLLLDEIFPTHERSTIIVEHHPQGAGSITISRTHEYAYVLTPKGIGIEGRVMNIGEHKWPLRRSGQGENNWRENRPNSFFAVLVDPIKNVVVGVGPEIPRETKKYPLGKTSEGYLRIYPIDKLGKERVWRYNRATMQKLIEESCIEYTTSGSLAVKKTGAIATPIFSVWKGSRYNAGVGGSNLLTRMMGEANTFPYPKSLYTVIDMLAMSVRNKKDSVILDFFAGSGTTGHAVMMLNKEDSGSRQFILCTNNENKIAEEVTYPRLKKVIKGVKEAEDITGISANLKYFKTDFIDSKSTDKSKKELVDKSAEMLCLKEGCYLTVKQYKNYKIFKDNQDKYLGIVYDDSGIEPFKEQVKKLNKKVIVYMFSLDDSAREEEFEEIKDLVELKPIPTAILNVYKRIFK